MDGSEIAVIVVGICLLLALISLASVSICLYRCWGKESSDDVKANYKCHKLFTSISVKTNAYCPSSGQRKHSNNGTVTYNNTADNSGQVNLGIEHETSFSETHHGQPKPDTTSTPTHCQVVATPDTSQAAIPDSNSQPLDPAMLQVQCLESPVRKSANTYSFVDLSD